MDVKKRVTKIMNETLCLERYEFGPEELLQDDLGVDSFDIVEIQMLLESEYDIKIPDETIEKWKTVGDIIDYVKKETGEE